MFFSDIYYDLNDLTVSSMWRNFPKVICWYMFTSIGENELVGKVSLRNCIICTYRLRWNVEGVKNYISWHPRYARIL